MADMTQEERIRIAGEMGITLEELAELEAEVGDNIPDDPEDGPQPDIASHMGQQPQTYVPPAYVVTGKLPEEVTTGANGERTMRALTQAEYDEAWGKVKVVKKPLPSEPVLNKTGRLPYFTRREVDGILSDSRSDEALAAVHGVGKALIARVRQKGRYAGVPYIPRDEVDRNEQRLGVQPFMSSMLPPKHKSRGRPYQSGRTEVLRDEQQQMADDPRRAVDIARLHGVSPSLVRKIKSEFARTLRIPARPMRPDDFMTVRNNDDMTAYELSLEYGISIEMVEAIKLGRFKDDPWYQDA